MDQGGIPGLTRAVIRTGAVVEAPFETGADDPVGFVAGAGLNPATREAIEEALRSLGE